MTDKERIKTIIQQYADKGERLLKESYENGEHASTTGYWDGYNDCANLLLRELEDIKQEPVSEDLWESSKRYALLQVLASTDAEMTEQAYLSLKLFSGFEIAVAHKDGANWQKQQLMAKAVDATVHIDAGGYPYIPQIELHDYDNDVPLAKEGDKYKVILIKED